MAMCLKCGAVLNDLDKGMHVCRAEDIPAKGTIKRVLSTSVAIEEL